MLSATVTQFARGSKGDALSPLVVISASPGMCDELWRKMDRDVYFLRLPTQSPSEGMPSAAAVIATCCASVRDIAGCWERGVSLGAVGLAGSIAYDVACSLESQGARVESLVLVEDQDLTAVVDASRRPWLLCWPLVAGMTRGEQRQFPERPSRGHDD